MAASRCQVYDCCWCVVDDNDVVDECIDAGCEVWYCGCDVKCQVYVVVTPGTEVELSDMSL